jgi:mannose-6-phosphate isomerase
MEVDRSQAQTLAQGPLRLAYNRVWRIYRGGRLIDEMRGAPNPADGQFPEDWTASDTRALNEGREHLVEGLSHAVLTDGQEVPLPQLLELAPEAFLGPDHVRRYGSRLALLVKLLDSAERLQVQAHPSPEFSQRYLNDRFGKTESWLILGTRAINGQDPYILLGFRERIAKETLGDLIVRQDTPSMEQALNRVPVAPGDMYILRAGVPHAIGPGVFMVEVQEPTDWVVSAEYQVGEVRLSEKAALMGLELDLALNVFDYEGPVGMDAVASATLHRRPGRSDADTILIGAEDTPFFSARELRVRGDVQDPYKGRAYSGIVVQGRGEIVGQGGALALNQGDSFFVPASSRHEGYRSAEGMTVIASFPPG